MARSTRAGAHALVRVSRRRHRGHGSADGSNRALRGREARARSVEERLRSLGSGLARAEAGFVPDYFVITDFDEFERHHSDLREYLTSNCQTVAEADRYLIYGSCLNTDVPDSRQ